MASLLSRKRPARPKQYDVFLVDRPGHGPEPDELKPIFTIARRDYPDWNPNNISTQRDLYFSIMDKNSNMTTKEKEEIWNLSSPAIEIDNEKIFIKLKRPLAGFAGTVDETSSSTGTPETGSSDLPPPVQCSSPPGANQQETERLNNQYIQLQESYSMLESRHDALKNRLRQVEDENDRNLQLKLQKERENAALQRQIDDIQSRLIYVQNESDAHARMLSEIEQEKAILERNMGKLELQLANTRKELEELHKLLQKRLEDQKDELEHTFRMQQMKLESELRQSDEKIKDKDALLEAMTTRMCEQEEALLKEKELRATEIHDKELCIAEKENTIAQQKFAIDTLQSAMKSTNAKIEFKGSQIRELKLMLNTKDETTMKLKEDYNTELKHQEKAFTESLNRKDRENKQLAEEMAKVKGEMASQADRLQKEILAENECHKVVVKGLQNEKSRLNDKLKEAREDLRKLEEHVNELASKNTWWEKASRARSSMTESVETITRSNRELTKQLDELKQGNKDKDDHIQKLQVECMELHKTLESQMEECKGHTEEIERLTTELQKNTVGAALLTNKNFIKTRLTQSQPKSGSSDRTTSKLSLPPTSDSRSGSSKGTMKGARVKGVKLPASKRES
ncbi:paramyosin [Lingula anatina]|uniref:Paramyosin n=1 Tax=Lingula anatina TaxID=7574 RepID=A0A1S3K9H8_LINAN|nr:paramyosin [Lingula anatina]|eukprot:XP_013419152.1 paramyosin [Lingula anatina]